jgi:aldehyde dehydrogenase (NAD+)
MSEREIADLTDRAYEYRCEIDGEQRAAILAETARRIELERDDVAQLISSESGLCIRSADKEVGRALDCLRVGARIAAEIDDLDLTPEFVRNADPTGPKLTVIHEPHDLIVGITPFNHPLNAVAHKVVPAVAAGTSMVLKPSDKTPLSALRLVATLVEAGLPADMLATATGMPAQRVVRQLVSDPRIDLVTFTGSVEVGKAIARTMAECGNELVRYVPELGGNACFVVMRDCDLDQAARIALGAFENSGQRCTAIRKILVDESIADPFVERFAALARELRYGDPSDPDVEVGTVITEEQAARLEGRVHDAVERGARLVLGNVRKGALYSPTIVDDVKPEFELANRESFGPVASVIRIRDLDDAIAIIRRGRFRLASAVATHDRVAAERLHREIAVGQFSWNGPPSYRTEQAPFGGFGDSGNGEKEGIIMTTRAYRRIRTVYVHDAPGR